jgi:Uma2 family endonuclease
MSSAVRILPHYTYNDWIHWEGQWELIDGIPYAMSPMPVPKHQRIAGNIFTEFRIGLKKCKNCNAYQPIDYKVSAETIVQPDMLVVCGKIDKSFLDFPPELVVEVLSPATALKDRHSKFDIYQNQQIKYYIIISPDQEEAEIYSLENNTYQLQEKGANFTYIFSLKTDCSITVDFKEIW